MHRRELASDENGFTTTLEIAEITETNVEEIGIAPPDAFSEELVYEPLDGTVKWFRDELHQVWVKFVYETVDDKRKSLVIPAKNVNFVQYPKD